MQKRKNKSCRTAPDFRQEKSENQALLVKHQTPQIYRMSKEKSHKAKEKSSSLRSDKNSRTTIEVTVFPPSFEYWNEKLEFLTHF
jgi:hypothetical protein